MKHYLLKTVAEADIDLATNLQTEFTPYSILLMEGRIEYHLKLVLALRKDSYHCSTGPETVLFAIY